MDGQLDGGGVSNVGVNRLHQIVITIVIVVAIDRGISC